MNNEIIPRTTLTMLVAAWRESAAEIPQAFGLLVSAEKRLKETFKPDSYLFDLSRTDSRYRRYEDPDELLKELKKDVWRVLIDRMELRRILSVKRNEELKRQTKTGEDLPEIDEAQLLAMLEGTLANPWKSTSASSCHQCPGGPEIFGPGGRPIGIGRNYSRDTGRTVLAFCVADTSSHAPVVLNCAP